MSWFKRFFYFILTNILVMITVSIAFNLILEFTGAKQYAGATGLLAIWSLVWGMGGAFISLLISKWTVKRMMGVQVINPQTANGTEADLVQIVHQLALNAGLTQMPEVGIYDAPEINAFATGRSRNSALVAVSTGLLRAMNKSQIEGVLGHEIAHIANGDMVTMTLIQGVVNAFVLFFSRILAGIIANNIESRNRDWIRFGLSMVFDIAFGILGSIVVCYFSRGREFRADAGGAKYAGREKMVSALKALQTQFEQIPADNSQAAVMKISSRSGGILGLFGTHPSLEERIARLQSASDIA
jgi:heat shock protein HtpX